MRHHVNSSCRQRRPAGLATIAGAGTGQASGTGSAPAAVVARAAAERHTELGGGRDAPAAHPTGVLGRQR